MATTEQAPSLDVDAYLARSYPAPACWNLVADVYHRELAADPTQVQTVSEAMRSAARAYRLALFKSRDGMHQVSEPRDFAIVLMWPTAKRRQLHCGIYYQGSVLHALDTAPVFQDLRTLRESYALMEFWAK